MKKETQVYICPQTKLQCDDECCVSAEDCHIEAGFGIVSDCEPPKQETLEEVAETFLPHSEIEHDTDFIIGFELGAKWQQEQDNKLYSDKEVKHLMTLAFEQGFKKADVVEAGLEAKETDTEVNWIFLKHKK